jgi:hypothetical protein
MGHYGDEQTWAVASSGRLRATRVGPKPILLGHIGLLWKNILSCAISTPFVYKIIVIVDFLFMFAYLSYSKF